jgi:hypothetical protein
LDASTLYFVVIKLLISGTYLFAVDISRVFKHKNRAAVAATRGDLRQLAPRKKLLKGFLELPRRFSETLQALLAWRAFLFCPSSNLMQFSGCPKGNYV